MRSELNNSRLVSKNPQVTGDQQEQLPCPRCDSTNTKFCYYNNYNFSQPRHFCKSCRRYWTHGGTLRDIPVGGVSRKTSKRSRSNSSSSSVAGSRNVPLQATPVLFPQTSSNCGNMAARGSASVPSLYGGFTSMLNSNAVVSGNGTNGTNGWFNGPDGFSLGLDHGSFFDDVRFGQGITAWPFSAGVTTDATTTTSHVAPMPTTWQFDFEGSENKVGFVSVSGTTPPQ